MNAHLIVGGGLAGISLAEQFLSVGEKVMLLDPSDQPSSTSVATGVANPIVFKRLNKSWRVDELAPFAIDFYSSIERKLSLQLLSETPIDKWVKSDDYKQFWNLRAQENEFENYLVPIEQDLGRVQNVFALDCGALTISYVSYLSEIKSYRNETFDYNELTIDETGFTYGADQFDSIIFCEGAYAVNNPLWNWLPFKVAKGDWVIIETEQPITDVILNNVVNIIPMGNNRYKLSSTFEWETMSWQPSESAIFELTKAFEERFNVPYKIIDHQSGLRPAASDRRPYLGEHPRTPKHFIFNGFGSKGVLLAPFFSKQLCDHILHQSALDTEVNIKRHLKRFQAQNP